MSRVRSFLLLIALTASVVLGATGCKTTESENTSSRPWNQPQGWENGIPGGMFQGGRY